MPRQLRLTDKGSGIHFQHMEVRSKRATGHRTNVGRPVKRSIPFSSPSGLPKVIDHYLGWYPMGWRLWFNIAWHPPPNLFIQWLCRETLNPHPINSSIFLDRLFERTEPIQSIPIAIPFALPFPQKSLGLQFVCYSCSVTRSRILQLPAMIAGSLYARHMLTRVLHLCYPRNGKALAKTR